MPPTRRDFLRALCSLPGFALAGGAGEPSAAAAQPRRGLETTPLSALGQGVEAQVCVIGSGPVGAILGSRLANRGVRTLLLESGPRRARQRDPRYRALDVYASSGIPYSLEASRYRGAGGTSNLWTGWCRPFEREDLEASPYAPKGAGWPVAWDELQPAYARAETELGVTAGPLSANSRRRVGEYLFDPLAAIEPLRQLVASSDLELEGIPVSDVGGLPLRAARSHLGSFSRSPHGTLVCGATVVRIIAGASGRIEGLEVRDLDGGSSIVRAGAYVIAAGAVESARLLLLSRSSAFPSGIGNGSDLVGRCFMTHYAGPEVRALVPGAQIGNVRLVAASEQYAAEARRRGLGAVRLMVSAMTREHGIWLAIRSVIEIEPNPANRIVLDPRRKDLFGDPGVLLHMQPSERDVATRDYAAKLVADALPTLPGIEVKSRGERLSFGSHHHMGGCRMGGNPATSVVDADLKVHGTENLYVAGCAPFVTCGVAHPTLNGVALAIRLGGHLAGSPKDGSAV